ncbi:SUMO-conjugating enzyme SCE1 [Vitis vinifera]|uniref:SUMO-conjugating enzyme SCE1 n=1 Tax=Vitis vinifera TaxID=29760 RepID=A0A438FBX9_VITVI|nr:SUMO-conjugating enzyme SCE1 [Vitis vinifera]
MTLINSKYPILTLSLRPDSSGQGIGRVCGSFQTDWEGGYFPLTLHFSEDYPSKPQNASSLKGWRPAITVKQILVGIQDLLDQPNPADPAQTEGYHLFIQVLKFPFFHSLCLELELTIIKKTKQTDTNLSATDNTQDAAEYKRRVRQQAKQYPPLVGY